MIGKLLERYVGLHKKMLEVLERLQLSGLRQMIQEIIDEYYSKIDSPLMITKTWHIIYSPQAISIHVFELLDRKTEKIVDKNRFLKNYSKDTRKLVEKNLAELQQLINKRLNLDMPPNLLWIILFPEEKKN